MHSLSHYRGGRDRMVVGFTTTYMQAVPITTKVVSSKPINGEVYCTRLLKVALNTINQPTLLL